VGDFICFVWHSVWGWPFRLAASRVRATRCHEPPLRGAGPGLSLVAFDRDFMPEAGVLAVFSYVWSLGKVFADIFV
jgi:hypothetical protein